MGGITECVVVLGAGEDCVETTMHQHLNWPSRLLGHPGTGQNSSWIREKREYLSKVRLRVLYIRSNLVEFEVARSRRLRPDLLVIPGLH